MGSSTNRNRWATGPMWGVFLLFALFPYMPFIGKYLSLGTEVLIWSLFALGFNILLGYTGLPSFGHGAFFGIGAYAAGIYFLRISQGVWGPLLLSVVVAGAFAALIGVFVAKKRGIYFALITIAVSQVFTSSPSDGMNSRAARPACRESTGCLSGIPGLVQIKLAAPLTYYYFVLVVFAVCTLLIWRIVHSPAWARSLQAIRENEVRASYLGYRTAAYRNRTPTLPSPASSPAWRGASTPC